MRLKEGRPLLGNPIVIMIQKVIIMVSTIIVITLIYVLYAYTQKLLSVQPLLIESKIKVDKRQLDIPNPWVGFIIFVHLAKI